MISIIAGSGYGLREARYELVDDVLKLVDEGTHDNLAGNSIVAEFGGLTMEEAKAKVEKENDWSPPHEYDGCHSCQWRIRIVE